VPEQPEDRDAVSLEVVNRDDGTWDLIRRGDDVTVLSNHPLRSMAEAERYRLAQAGAADADWSGEVGNVGATGAYPDNTGG
jgi:hypothetical protein